ncbi:MAG: acetyltransferase [Bacteroidetes bacterium]|nr:acetyltransferase [Bacteroidota bacterium]
MILIIGAGGHGLVVKDILECLGSKMCLFADEYKMGQLDSVEIITLHEIKAIKYDAAIIAVGNNYDRKNLATTLNINYTSLVHPRAIIAKSSEIIGNGTVVMAGAIINPHVSIGEHTIINTGAIIEHESIIMPYAHIAPHATLCGNVHIGEGTLVGAGAIILPGIRIGNWAVIGAGAVVTKNVLDHEKVIGNPARKI